MSDLLDLSPPGQLSNDSLAGARVFFYDAGTTTLRTVYSDQGLTTPHPSPLLADADGLFATVFVSGTAVKAVVQDANGASLYTLDPCAKVPAGGAGASSVSFAPTVDIPVTNVQAAIERVQTNIIAPVAGFGLGVTGSATLLANIDATNIASGAYRYDNTATGTFPVGVAASDTGIVETWRETSGTSIQLLYPENADRIFFRRFVAPSWGAWTEVFTAARIASQSEAEAGVNNDKPVTPLRVKQAIDANISTSAVLSATAGASVGAVGTFAFLAFSTQGADASPGSTYAGSGLVYAGLANQASYLSSSTTSPSGTWRAMGHVQANSGNLGGTLFLRIS